MATQPGREQLLAIGYAIFLAHGVQPGGLPGFVQSLDDESGHTRLELIGVRLEPAILGLHESASKGDEGVLCAQPNEATLPVIDTGFVGIVVARAQPAVPTAGRDTEHGPIYFSSPMDLGNVG